MDVKLLKHTAINSFALMLMVIAISIAISQNNQTIIYADDSVKQGKIANTQNQEGDNNISNLASETGKTRIDDSSILVGTVSQQLSSKYLIIKKSKNSLQNVNIEDLYMERSINVTITDIEGEPFNDSSFVRINQGIEYTGKPITESEDIQGTSSIAMLPEGTDEISDPVKGFSIEYINQENTNLYTATIHIELDNIYAPVIYQDLENIYIDLRRPKDVYDKIIVLDAGHGGTDCGTFSEGEQYYEKDINLSILLYLKEILDQKDIKVYYTRTTDQTVFLNPRVNLANDVEADFFLSIHCNAYESPLPDGSEILYNELKPTEGFQSKQLAQICLEEITNVTHKTNRGLVNGSEIVIIQKAKMPMALIEVAFMSNQDDLEFLLQEDNKRDIADALYNVIKRAYDELEP